MQKTPPPAAVIPPRPWLTRRPRECPFPMDGEGAKLLACCRPCEGTRYCPTHLALMRDPKAASGADFERRVLAWLETRR